MKDVAILKCFGRVCYLCVLCLTFAGLGGCLSSPGETSAEIHRKHMNTINTNVLQLQDDVDAVLLLDQPTRLSEKHTR
jgi:hypothetical protein